MEAILSRPQYINQLTPGRCSTSNLKIVIFHMLQIKFKTICCEISLKWMPQNIFVMIGQNFSGNGLVHAGNKPLSKQMLTHSYVPIWRH